MTDWSSRDKIGVGDMVMLPDVSEKALFENLKKRYVKGSIYTFIGNVLISMNPYKDIGCFTQKAIDLYNGQQPFVLDAHVFAVSDMAYRALLSDGESQAIIVSGESGAGKTEVCKGIMRYISAVSGGGAENIERTKDVMLQSNPLLESFGNAKTLRNNNSSRFGKLLSIVFSFTGDPESGRVETYLLEKSRVVAQIDGERNFHIFYQVFNDGQLGLSKPQNYRYLSRKGLTVKGIDDRRDFDETKVAMQHCGIQPEEQTQFFEIVAGVLELGEIEFQAAGDKAEVKNKPQVAKAAALFGLPQPQALGQALVTRQIRDAASGKMLSVPNTPAQAADARDALAKGVYARLFDLVVGKINKKLAWEDTDRPIIGILDIFGFEIFDNNKLEQLFINFCNESLQQVFIRDQLVNEQKAYADEGVPWTPVEYFDNKPTCELISGKMGVMALLDEACIMPKATEQTFADKLYQHCQSKQAFIAGDGSARKMTGPPQGFGLKHYAGDVFYRFEGILTTNRDTFYTNLSRAMLQSSKDVMKQAFAPDAAKLQAESGGGQKRPITASKQFVSSVNKLMTLLYSCAPHYIRCIKPNEEKRALHCDDTRTLEQVRYLGLLENLKVRRAGFCYRKEYEKWIDRYYLLTPRTFPNWNRFASAKEAVHYLLRDHMKLPDDAYALGKTKLFIRNPETLYAVEKQRIAGLNRLATIMQATWKMYKVRKAFLAAMEAAKDIFEGKKERRRDSLTRTAVAYFGDMLLLNESATMASLKAQFGDMEVKFSDQVSKITRKLKALPRVFVVTDKAIYHCVRLSKPNKLGSMHDVRRRTPIDKIERVVLSELQDNYIVICIANEVDYVLELSKKTVLCTALVNVVREQLQGKQLPVEFKNEITYMSPKGPMQISFGKDEARHEARFAKNKKGFNIFIASGQK